MHKLCAAGKNNAARIQSTLPTPGIDVNARNNFGCTPLHEAVANGSYVNMRIINQKTKWYDSPLCVGVTGVVGAGELLVMVVTGRATAGVGRGSAGMIGVGSGVGGTGVGMVRGCELGGANTPPPLTVSTTLIRIHARGP